MFEHDYAEYQISEARERAAKARLAKQARNATKHRRRAPGRARLAAARLLVRFAHRLVERPSSGARSRLIDTAG